MWLAQCFCEAVEALADCKLVESAKAEEQRIWIRASESASIDGENLNALGSRSLFCASRCHSILEVADGVEAGADV